MKFFKSVEPQMCSLFGKKHWTVAVVHYLDILGFSKSQISFYTVKESHEILGNKRFANPCYELNPLQFVYFMCLFVTTQGKVDHDKL